MPYLDNPLSTPEKPTQPGYNALYLFNLYDITTGGQPIGNRRAVNGHPISDCLLSINLKRLLLLECFLINS